MKTEPRNDTDAGSSESRATPPGSSALRARRQSTPLVLLLSWLVPGYGFMVNGHVKRGVYFFVILELTFLVGAFLYGSVLLPEFRPSREGFNLVTILTFFTQIFNGGLGIISLLPEIFGRGAAILPYNEANQWADLGSFFLLVSGGMNYFVIVNTYDHFLRNGLHDKQGAARRREARP
jgi:hypothetical protein